jgi:hypothetical protein
MDRVAQIWQRIEQVGPYFVAAYACPTGDLGEEYMGYFKVFPLRPHTYFDAGSMRGGFEKHRHESPEFALDFAMRAARASLEGR